MSYYPAELISVSSFDGVGTLTPTLDTFELFSLCSRRVPIPDEHDQLNFGQSMSLLSMKRDIPPGEAIGGHFLTCGPLSALPWSSMWMNEHPL